MIDTAALSRVACWRGTLDRSHAPSARQTKSNESFAPWPITSSDGLTRSSMAFLPSSSSAPSDGSQSFGLRTPAAGVRLHVLRDLHGVYEWVREPGHLIPDASKEPAVPHRRKAPLARQDEQLTGRPELVTSRRIRRRVSRSHAP